MKMNENTFNIHWGKFLSILFLVLCLIIPGYFYLNIHHRNIADTTIGLILLFVSSVMYSFPVLVLGMVFFSLWWGDMRVLWKNNADESSNYSLMGISSVVALIIFYSTLLLNWLVHLLFKVEWISRYFYEMLAVTTVLFILGLLTLRLSRKRHWSGAVK